MFCYLDVAVHVCDIPWITGGHHAPLSLTEEPMSLAHRDSGSNPEGRTNIMSPMRLTSQRGGIRFSLSGGIGNDKCALIS